MAPRFLTIILELFFVVLLLGVFAALIGKYFFPDELRTAPQQVRADVTSELAFRQARLEFEQFPDVYAPKAEGHAKSVPLLVYHGLAPTEYKADVLSEEFRNQMYTLKRAGWNTVTLREFEDFLAGERQLPDKSFVLTFDDGIRSSYYQSDPVLRALNYSAVMFTISKRALAESNKYYLAYPEMQDMLATKRWEIQAHARDAHELIPVDDDGGEGHFLSNKQWLANVSRLETNEEFRARIHKDFELTKYELENGFNKKITSYAFPFGDYGQNTLNFPGAENIVWDEVHDVFDHSYYQWWPGTGYTQMHQGETTPEVKRLIVYRGTTGKKLLRLLERGRQKEMSYKDDLEENNGWLTVWGNVTQGNERLTLKQVPDAPGSLTFLDGTGSWKDYEFNARVHSFDGKSASLIGLFQDLSTYASCDFSEQAVRIRQVTHNDTLQLASMSSKEAGFVLPDHDFLLGMRVNNNTLTCLLDNAEIVSAPHTLGKGGIGFKLGERMPWEGRPGTLVIEEYSVEPVDFKDEFEEHGVIEEVGDPEESPHPDWWLNSGGSFIKQNGIGSTLTGELAPQTKWHLAYAETKPLNTENGRYPQNIFRLLTRSKWTNFRQEVYFRAIDYHLTTSPQRNESNGVLLFSRYLDDDDLYYAGVRVDGSAVIKKKSGGDYHEIAQKQIFPGAYDIDKSPNLLPMQTWIGLRTETVTLPDGSVQIKLYLDESGTGDWELVLEGIDDSTKHGPELLEPGRAGIRSDFLDVEFDHYRITRIV